MTEAVYVAIYGGLLIFLGGCIWRVREYARLPIHLRWELYPVPHEEPTRVAHGGSYFESSDWWSKPQHKNLAGELRIMLPEILFLKGLWEFKRRLWLPAFLFHWGLYLSIATCALCGGGVVLLRAAPDVSSSRLWFWFVTLYHITGYGSALFILLGALLLLVLRTTDAGMKNYTKPADVFNLLFFIVTFALLAAGYLFRPTGAAGVFDVAAGLSRFDTAITMGMTMGLGLILASALVAYIPFTHMSHFIAKYFTYHAVRWDDHLSTRGGAIEAKVAQYLTYRPTWAAAHVGADGKKNWTEIATTNLSQEVRR